MVERVIQTGVLRGSDIVLHDPAAHEAYGRVLGARTGWSPGDVVTTGPLEIDLYALSVTVGRRPVILTSTELALLVALARRAGAAVPHVVLAEAVWGPPGLLVPEVSWRHALRVSLSRLRQKLYPVGALVVSIYDVGWRLELIGPDDPLPALWHPRAVLRGRRWAIDWDACRRCGRTEIPHNGHGYCTSCFKTATSRTRGDHVHR